MSTYGLPLYTSMLFFITVTSADMCVVGASLVAPFRRVNIYAEEELWWIGSRRLYAPYPSSKSCAVVIARSFAWLDPLSSAAAATAAAPPAAPAAARYRAHSSQPDARHAAAAIVVPVLHLAPRPALRLPQPQTRTPRTVGQSALLLQQPQTGAPGDEGAAARGRRRLRATLRGAGCGACSAAKGTGRADRVLTLTPNP